MNSGSVSKVCVACNVGWIIISVIGSAGALNHASSDYLFIIRYSLALSSSIISLVGLRCYPKQGFGRLSILLFSPFIFLELIEMWMVSRCSAGRDSVWGVDCSRLVMYRDDARYIELLTDELAVLFLAIAYLLILWRCHITQGHLIYGMKKMRKVVSAEPFLSATSEDRGVSEFLSADEEAGGGGLAAASPKVYNTL
jgi:hypothetical protein